MRKLILSIALSSTILVGVQEAQAQTYRMHIIQYNAHVSTQGRANLANANSWYVANRLHWSWNTNGLLFVQHAWNIPIYVTTRRTMEQECGSDAAACHGTDYHGHPVIVVGKFDSYFSLYFSHEVAETMVDPHVNRISTGADGQDRYVEVGDPVEDQFAVRDHVYLSDYVLPSWFRGDDFGPYDRQHVLDAGAPETTEGGYDPLVNGSTHKRFNSRFQSTVHSTLFSKAIAIPKR